MACYTTNDRGTSNFSLAKVAECTDFPNQPTDLLATVSSSTKNVTFTWVDPSDYDAYKSSSSVLIANLYYKLKTDSWANQSTTNHVFINVKPVAVNSYIIPNSSLTLGAVYVMRVQYVKMAHILSKKSLLLLNCRALPYIRYSLVSSLLVRRV
jgi:hypothetical protein